MKAILEFNLPEEQNEHKLALDGSRWMSVCEEFDRWLRSIQKHTDRDTLTVAEARAHLHEEMASAGLSFD